MIRRALIVSIALFLVTGPPAAWAKPRDPVALATGRARSRFNASLRDAESSLATATSTIRDQLVSGVGTHQTAITTFGTAFAYFAGSVKLAADEASTSLATELSQVLDVEGDPGLHGAIAGDGGALDAFAQGMQSALDGARNRAIARARKFGKALADGTARTKVSVVVPSWTFDHLAAPSPLGAVPPGEAPIRLLAVLMTRLDEGQVVATVAGSAASALSGDFDVRLSGRSQVHVVGAFISAGGMLVNGGVWSATSVLNDPFEGETVDEGNYVILFGVEPVEAGPPAGRQPTRLQQAGVIGAP